MITSFAPRTVIATCLLGLSVLIADHVYAQCPERLAPSLVNSLQTAEMRSQAAQMPPLTAGFIAQNGGAAAMIEKMHAQIAADRAWLAQEEANQGTIAQQGLGNIDRAQAGRQLLQMKRDELRLNEAVLRMLQCHGGSAGRSPSSATALGGTPTAADSRRWQEDAERGMVDDRERMVAGVTRGWQPPRGYANGSAAAPGGLDLEDPFAAGPDECRPSITFRSVSLSGDGRSVHYEMSAVHSAQRPCTVSFAIQMMASGQPLRLPSRTLVIPTGGATLSETATLPVAVDQTMQACAQSASWRGTYEAKRNEQVRQYEKLQNMTRDTLRNRAALERSVGTHDLAIAVTALSTAVDTLKLGLSVVSPAAGAALGFGQCVGVELSTFVAKTVAACTAQDARECTTTVLTDGAVWVEKNLSCAFTETYATVDKIVDGLMLAKQASELTDMFASRTKTLLLMDELQAAASAAEQRIARLRNDRTFVDEAINRLDAACRSPRIELTAVDVQTLATGK